MENSIVPLNCSLVPSTLDPTQFFIKNVLKDENEWSVKATQEVIQEWVQNIPFSPIRNFATETKFVSFAQHANYRVTLTTQIETRRFQEHEIPDDDQPASEGEFDLDALEIWSFEADCINDFQDHQKTLLLDNTRVRRSCSSCDSKGIVECKDCNGYGRVRCGECEGSRMVQRSKRVDVLKKCSSCDGDGWKYEDFTSSTKITCPRCNGRGSRMEGDTQYYDVTCPRCAGTGAVTCRNCSGEGTVTCPTCDGKTRVIHYYSLEQSESPHQTSDTFFNNEVPEFASQNSPTSQFNWNLICSQEDSKVLEAYVFSDLDAGGLLKSISDTLQQALCDHIGSIPHSSRVVRQEIRIEQAIIDQYTYSHQGADYSLFVNTSARLIEDTEGPFFQAKNDTLQTAKTAFDSGDTCTAFIAVQKCLITNGATPDEIALRDKILKQHFWPLLKCALAASFTPPPFPSLGKGLWLWFWYTAHLAWVASAGLGFIPLLVAVWVYSNDFALTRPLHVNQGAARAIGRTASICYLWLTLPALVITWFSRKAERGRRHSLEKHLSEFKNAQEIEAYINALSDEAVEQEAEAFKWLKVKS